MMTTSNEHNNAPAVPQVWVNLLAEARNTAYDADGWIMDPDLASAVDDVDAMLAATPAPAPAQEPVQCDPFGYFRPEPFGWTDCAKDDEGAVALYERPQESELRKELDSANDFIKSLADLIQKYETMLGYRTTNAPEGAYALAEAKGESSLNTELDLACADFTCQHDFALDPKSSIRICLKCGTPERLSKNAAAPAQEVATLSLSAEDVHAAFAKNFPKSRISQAWINFAADIAQAIAARAAKSAQEVGLTDEEIDENTVWLDPDPHDNVHCDVSATVRKCLAAIRAKGGK